MRLALIVTFLCALLAGCAIQANADETASAANVLLVLQAADDATTRSIIEHGGYERDPLARGLVRSNWGMVVSTLVFNALTRMCSATRPRSFGGSQRSRAVRW